MKPNRFRQVVKEGRIPLGTMVWEFGTRGMPKILEAADLDFVLIDMEHSTFDGERVADLLALFKATPIAPFVRVPQPLYHFLARAMDAGALGVMVANVETPEQAREIVGAVKYAPMGHRGVGLGSAHTDYVVPDPASYFREANENTTVIAMIESPRGLAERVSLKHGVQSPIMPALDILTPTEIRAPRGTHLRCKGWKQEAALRMLMNNLDPEVAERPQDLVVYGGAGKAARDWPSFHAIVRELEALGNDETLLVQSGKPVGVF